MCVLFVCVWSASQSLRVFQAGSIKASSVLLRIGGPPGAGKSTFVDSLLVKWLVSFVRREFQADKGDTDARSRTRGFRCFTYLAEDGAEFTIMDLGGHGEFFASHQAMISAEEMPVVNMVFLSALQSLEEMLTEASKWASFFARKVQQGSPRQPLLLVASRDDKAKEMHRQNVWTVFKALDEFDSYFYLPYPPCFLDCRKSWDERMKSLRTRLLRLRERVLEASCFQTSEIIETTLLIICMVVSQ